MASSAISGHKAKLHIMTQDSTEAAVEIGELRNFTLTVEAEEIDVTSHDSSGWRERIYGLRTWGLDGEALYVDDNTGQDQIREALSSETVKTITVVPTTGDKNWQGDAIATSWDLGGPNDDAAITNFSVVGTGAISTSTGP
ncbi:MAG: phage tail tube protein [Gemmatimonadota bacterium]